MRQNEPYWIGSTLGVVILIGLMVIGACSEAVDHKASGGVQVDSQVTITQDICVEKNGFVTPADRRECVLCVSGSALCSKCAKPAD